MIFQRFFKVIIYRKRKKGSLYRLKLGDNILNFGKFLLCNSKANYVSKLTQQFALQNSYPSF